MPPRTSNPTTITGLQAFRGEGAPVAKGFWADAWERVLKQPTAVLGLTWIGVIAFFAVFAPVLSSGHPLIQWEIDRRTSADSAAWFAQQATISGDGQRLREGITRAEVLTLLEQEFARHANLSPRSLASTVGLAMTEDYLTPTSFQAVLHAIRAAAELDPTGVALSPTSPLLQHLTATDWTILVFGTLGVIPLVLPRRLVANLPRSRRLALLILYSLQAAATILLASTVSRYFTARDAPDWARALEISPRFVPIAATVCTSLVAALFCFLPVIPRPMPRLVATIVIAAITGSIVALTWRTPPGSFDAMDRQRLGEIRAIYTLVPWSSNQRPSDRDASAMPPGTTHDQALANIVRAAIPPLGVRESTPADIDAAIRLTRELPLPVTIRERIADDLEQRFGGRSGITPAMLRQAVHQDLAGVGKQHLLGTDKFGQDVLAQLLHACRLAISMGLVATGLATVIGVTMGALMGYFGGWVDMLLYRVVEIFMAIPVLFLLIVAAAVLERNTYVMMAIIGCVTWHGAARYTRAEFMKLRSMDFVQSARAVGLPLRSILFKHMLPNGVTPVLVDASFGIASAILLEAVLSYLGLGPPDQPSWGRVLADSAGDSGTFNWWLGVYPGLAINLTVLSLTMIGEALRDAIDPKLKKARV